MKKLRPKIQKKYLLLFLVPLVLFLFLLLLPIFSTHTTSNLETVAEENNIAPLMVVDESGNFVADELIVKFRQGTTDDQKTQIVSSKNASVYKQGLDPTLQLIKVDPAQREQIMQDLAGNPDVEYVEKNTVNRLTENTGGSTFTPPNDPYYQSQWHLQRILAPIVWNYTKGSSNIIVATIDSGVNYNHPDLVGKVLKGRDLVNSDNDPMDDYGHGTRVAGVFGAVSNNGKDLTGTDWHAQILAVKAFDSQGGGNSFRTAHGINWVLQNTLQYPGMKVIILPLYGEFPDETLRRSVKAAIDQGVIIISGTHNSPTPNCFMGYPAAYNNVFAVTGTNKADQWTMGCLGNVDSLGNINNGFRRIAAPSRDIYVLDLNGGAPYLDGGTSYGSAQVGAVASILLSCNGGLTVNVTSALLVGNDDLGQGGYDNTFGYGRINMFKAYNQSYCSLGGRIRASGDVDCNADIALKDSQETLKYINNLEAGTETCGFGVFTPLGDVDNNGSIDNIDALYTSQYVAGLRDIDSLSLIPPEVDSDGDKITDSQEQAYSCLNPNINDADSDPDNDSIHKGSVNINSDNITEIIIGTNPCVFDTDGDYFSDAAESYMGVNPLDSCSETTGSNDEPLDAWPLDFNDTKTVNIIDVLFFGGKVGKPADSEETRRLDLNTDGTINIIDVLQFGQKIGTSCS